MIVDLHVLNSRLLGDVKAEPTALTGIIITVMLATIGTNDALSRIVSTCIETRTSNNQN